MVSAHGDPGEFGSSMYIYLQHDGMKYWMIGASVESATVLNRAET
jgi:6-phosphogluconate dehydrogenase (decarboxylating)